MRIVMTPLPGVLLIEPDVHPDGRGFFLESYRQDKFIEAGLPARFVQDNHSRSIHDTLRGLHAQISRPQGKLIRVVFGEIFDVAVDIRRGSPTYKLWHGTTLSSGNFRQCYVPPGYAHGFCVLSDAAEVVYKVTDYYDPADELHLLWNDLDLGINWPIARPILSPKDQAGVRLKDIEPRLPVHRPPVKPA